MPKVELPFEAILEATEQLNLLQLEALLQRATELKQLQLREQQQEEARLLAIWAQAPMSQTDRSHIEDLIRRSEEDEISEAERQEILRIDKMANENQAKRLQAVIDLAHLRGMEPSVLLDQLQARTS